MHSPALLVVTSEKPTVAFAVSDGASQTHLAVSVLGNFTVSVNGAAIDASRWKFKHPRLLCQMLCLAPGHRVSRDEAAEALWPQASVQASSNRLYHTLHTLRAVLIDAGLVDARRLVQLQAGTLWLDASLRVDVDATRFGQAVSAARACNGHDAALPHLETARGLHRGALALPAQAGDWFAPHRQALLRDHVWVLEQLAERYQAAGRIDEAIGASQALVQAEPSNETAHRRLIQLYDAQGRPDLMAQQYTACSRYLRRDLGVEPSPAAQQLAQRIGERLTESKLHQTKAAPSRGPNSRPARKRFVAPARATPLLGRHAELDELQRWLLAEGSRLITIAAAGGIGKTRLAAALAEQVQDQFADGVVFVALGDVQRPSRLAERVGQALGLSSAEQPADAALLQGLASLHLLLVLDRFEHLVEAAPQLAHWLQTSPRLHIVVTSQCPLKSRAERVYELLPLLQRCEAAAMDLFVQTAERAGVRLDAPSDQPMIRRVCENVGGNALAIELAAAQLATVALVDLPAALQMPLQVLVGVSPDGEAQHASLQSTISWSVALLTPQQAQLLSLLSVFAGDFDSDRVQAVIGALFDDGALQPLLRTLLERHLLFRRSSAGDLQLAPFAIADAVRQHARQRAATLPQWPQALASHAQYFSHLVAQAADLVQAGHGGRAHDIYRAAAADIEQAVRWQREHADRLTYLRACWKVAGLHGTFGALHEAMECLQGATTLVAEGREERDQSAWCHYMMSRVASALDNAPAAVRAARAARQLAQGSQDQRLLGMIAIALALLRCTQLRVAQALPLIEGAIRSSRRQGATELLAGQCNVLATCLALRGDYEGAAAACDEALDCALATNNPQAALWALVSAAEISIFRGQIDRAQALLHECRLLLDAGYSVESDLHVALLSFYVAFERADFERAIAPLEEALAVCRGSMVQRAIMIGIEQEFVFMETSRFSQATILRTLTDEQLAFSYEYSSAYVAAHSYGMFLHALDADWAAVLASLARMRHVVRATGNALWAAWLAQAAVMAAHRVGCAAMGRQFLDQSRRLLVSRNLTPSARQVGTWRNMELLLSQTAAGPHDAAPPALIDALQTLGAELDGWCEGAKAASTAAPRSNGLPG